MLNRLPAFFVPLLALVAVLLALPAATPSAQAQASQEIEQMLRERDRQIKTILGPSGTPSAGQRERLREVVNDVIDFEAMAQQALGSYWSQLSAPQQRAFVDAFGGVVRAQSLADLELYRARVSYGDISVDGNNAVARTTAGVDGKTIGVDYHLHRRSGTWYVTDIVIDGTGTVAGYANSFQRVMRQQGVEAGYDRLMQSFERRLQRAG